MNITNPDSSPQGTDNRDGDSTAKDAGPVFDVSRTTRLWMLVLSWLPLVHVLLVGAAVWAGAYYTVPVAVAAGLVVLYVLPPLTVRLILGIRPITEGWHELESRAFRTWWLTAQCQVLFNRLPFLEEALRIVPAVYSFWLRLWGAKVGKCVFWSPGTVVLDRTYVHIGDYCVMGLGVRLHPHLITKQDGNQAVAQLCLAPVRIGVNSIIGGFSLLAPGVVVSPGSMTPAIQALPAFSEWQSGRRTRGARPTIV